MHLVSRAGQGFARRGAADHQRPCLADIAMRAVGQLDAVPAADFPDEPRAVAGAQAAEDGGIGRRSFAHEHRARHALARRSEEHTSELQSLMRISYAVFCLKKKKYNKTQ